ncbi:MAG: DUF2911 domain-containing protein [Flavitalea sp.]
MTIYKRLSYLASFLFFLSCQEQNNPVIRQQEQVNAIESNGAIANPPLDKSMMDVSYYPGDFTVQKMGGKAEKEPIARIFYSRPARNGRAIFGEIVKYGKPWRLGANEATEIEFFRDVLIQGKDISKGKYTLYCIPFEERWELILNSSLYTWGLKINPSADLEKFSVRTESLPFTMEYLSMQFIPSENHFALQISWDKTKVILPISAQ